MWASTCRCFENKGRTMWFCGMYQIQFQIWGNTLLCCLLWGGCQNRLRPNVRSYTTTSCSRLVPFGTNYRITGAFRPIVLWFDVLLSVWNIYWASSAISLRRALFVQFEPRRFLSAHQSASQIMKMVACLVAWTFSAIRLDAKVISHNGPLFKIHYQHLQECRLNAV